MSRRPLALLSLVVLAAALLWPYDPIADVDPTRAGLGPSPAHWLGTDAHGRDVARRVIAGTRAFAVPAGVAVAIALLLGGGGGALSGWLAGVDTRGRTYRLAPAGSAVRLVLGAVASIPRFVAVLVVCAILDGGVLALGLACGLACAPGVAEGVRSRIAALRDADFVQAARARGHADADVLVRHVLFSSARDVLARHAREALAFALVAETTLSYLGGFGVAEPAPSWGNMVASGLSGGGNPLVWIAPSLAMVGMLALLQMPPAAREDDRTGERTDGPDQPHDAPDSRHAIEPDTDATRLVVAALRVTDGRGAALIDGVDLTVPAGTIVALVGPSGAGKSLTARALLDLLPPGLAARGRLTRGARGSLVGALWQDARGSLDPLRTVRAQVEAARTLRTAERGAETSDRSGSDIDGGRTAEALARRLGLADDVLDAFPHALSGGMAQRAAIAVAVARGSRFLVADEPTTGLDAPIAREVLALLRELRDTGVGILFVTHDLRLLPGFADTVVVMDGGRTVEARTDLRALETPAGVSLLAATRGISAGALGSA